MINPSCIQNLKSLNNKYDLPIRKYGVTIIEEENILSWFSIDYTTNMKSAVGYIIWTKY